MATANPEPIVADRSIEFETVTDRTPVGFRDNAAYALLLERARGKSPAELAAVSRRDVALAHLWQNPETLSRRADPPARARRCGCSGIRPS